ncbi:MAG: DoxX family protein [Cyanophyceae cyanobacterium]
MKSLVPLLARIFLSAIFIKSGVDKIISPQGTVQTIQSQGIPGANVLVILTIIVLLVGGVLVLLGWQSRLGALLLIGFLIPTTLIFHTNFAESSQQIAFLKNLGLIGGLLMIVAFGPGTASVDW